MFFVVSHKAHHTMAKNIDLLLGHTFSEEGSPKQPFQNGKVSSQLLSAMSQGGGNDPMLALINIPGGGQYHVLPEKPTKEHIKKLIDNFGANALEMSILE